VLEPSIDRSPDTADMADSVLVIAVGWVISAVDGAGGAAVVGSAAGVQAASEQVTASASDAASRLPVRVMGCVLLLGIRSPRKPRRRSGP
jgi:hypothetical protein